MSTALVFGANGISGIATLRQLSASTDTEWRKIIAISRRAPLLDHDDSRITFRSVDLLSDPQKVMEQLRETGAEETTHVFFYAYIAKQDEMELIEINRDLLGNAIAAVSQLCKKVELFQLQTGYKYYGTHLGGQHLAPYPWKENSPRHEGANFYYVQEDMVKEAAEKNGWKWIITRPNFIIGTSKGNYMSLAVTIALYAIARKALDQPLVFPGSSISYNQEYDHSLADNNAAFQLYSAQHQTAGNRIYNIHDGKPVKFSQLWPKVANYFDIPLASPPADDPPRSANAGSDVITVHSAAEWAESNKARFAQIAEDAHLPSGVFDYATWSFFDFSTSRTWSDMGALGEARSIGWDKEVDSFEEGYKVVFDDLKRMGIIPP